MKETFFIPEYSLKEGWSCLRMKCSEFYIIRFVEQFLVTTNSFKKAKELFYKIQKLDYLKNLFYV